VAERVSARKNAVNTSLWARRGLLAADVFRADARCAFQRLANLDDRALPDILPEWEDINRLRRKAFHQFSDCLPDFHET